MDDLPVCNPGMYTIENETDCINLDGTWEGYFSFWGQACEDVVAQYGGDCDTAPLIQYWDLSDLCPAACGVCCGDEAACNINGDGSCEYLDDCGVCGGYNTCFAPDNMQYVTSTKLAYYNFETVTIASVELTSDDWVGAFNGDVCVGARQWDTSLCNNGVCDVPTMGYDGYIPGTENYLVAGNIPTFKIYDESEDQYYNAVASEDVPAWVDLGYLKGDIYYGFNLVW